MQRVLDVCETVLTYVAAFSTFCMMILTTGDAAGRYFFNRPINGAFEITTNYFMVASVFLAMTYAYRGGANIRVTFLVDRLPPSVRLAINYLIQIASVLYCALLVYASVKVALQTIALGETLGSLAIPLGPAYLLIPAGLVLMVVSMLWDVRKVSKGESPLFQDESPDS